MSNDFSCIIAKVLVKYKVNEIFCYKMKEMEENMNVKILKNKKFYIPTERIKEAKAGAEKEEKLIQRIDNMTDEEYDAYIEAELAKADEQIANGQLIS